MKPHAEGKRFLQTSGLKKKTEIHTPKIPPPFLRFNLMIRQKYDVMGSKMAAPAKFKTEHRR